VDLDRTDRLPVLAGTQFDDDVEDDAVRLDYAPVVPSVKTDMPRAAGVDLPSLAESVRSVEERIARQNAEFEALSRSYEKALDAEAAALARSQTLTADLAGLRTLLESEQSRSRDMDRVMAEKDAAIQAVQARIEEAVRESERFQSEARTLRDTLAARDATIAQVTHSLGERDAQLSALQREHARIVPALEERSRIGVQLEADLRDERERAGGIAAALRESERSAAALSARLKSGDYELDAARRELQMIKAQSAAHLEALRSREWRRGFDLNLFRELDAKIGAAQDDRGALQNERDQLRQRVAEVESQIAAREEAIDRLKAAAADDAEQRTRQDQKLELSENARIELMQKLAALEDERGRLHAELASRDEKIAGLQAAALDGEAAREAQQGALHRSEEARAELVEKIAVLERDHGRLTEELKTRDASIAAMQAAAIEDAQARAKHELMLQQVERACAELTGRIAALETEKSDLSGEVTVRTAAVAAAQAATLAEAQRGRDLLAGAQQEMAELAGRISLVQAEVRQREEEIAALTEQLAEARRPLEPIQAEVSRLTDELAARTASMEQLNEDNRALRAALDRTRGALEEREFLIRRLERSESNNANVLGRIQTSIERLGSPSPIAGNAAAPVECSAELVRVDGQNNTSHPLARRTRIGRAPGCEMQIDSSSVSRHHALVLMSSRDVVIEDLNSTNGVLVNGRKVSRQLLHDGDLLAIGDAQFRLSLKPAPRTLDSTGAGPP
jgi:chromosome segregation ATPase